MIYRFIVVIVTIVMAGSQDLEGVDCRSNEIIYKNQYDFEDQINQSQQCQFFTFKSLTNIYQLYVKFEWQINTNNNINNNEFMPIVIASFTELSTIITDINQVYYLNSIESTFMDLHSILTNNNKQILKME